MRKQSARRIAPRIGVFILHASEMSWMQGRCMVVCAQACLWGGPKDKHDVGIIDNSFHNALLTRKRQPNAIQTPAQFARNHFRRYPTINNARIQLPWVQMLEFRV
jgi:hypothetical protein